MISFHAFSPNKVGEVICYQGAPSLVRVLSCAAVTILYFDFHGRISGYNSGFFLVTELLPP